MRFLLRFISLLFLAAAVIVGIIDSIQSVAGQTVALTPLGAALFTLNPDLLASAETYFQVHLSAYVWNTVIEWILIQPAFAVFLFISFLLWLVAYRNEPASRLAARQR